MTVRELKARIAELQATGMPDDANVFLNDDEGPGVAQYVWFSRFGRGDMCLTHEA